MKFKSNASTEEENLWRERGAGSTAKKRNTINRVGSEGNRLDINIYIYMSKLYGRLRQPTSVSCRREPYVKGAAASGQARKTGNCLYPSGWSGRLQKTAALQMTLAVGSES